MKIIDQESEGFIWFDHQAGRVIESRLQQQLEFETTTRRGTINSNVETEMHLTLTPVSDE